jgi:putative RNA 2'-phosphotransferase
MSKIDKLGKELAYLLRHCPEAKNLTMDAHGWVKIEELITNAPEFTSENLKEIVSTDKKGRYSISSDGLYIRANQGHSVNVDLELVPINPPTTLYHGTVEKFLPSIFKNGLLKQERHHVHMSSDIDTAINVGKRRGVPVVLGIDAEKMVSDGFVFYCSDNGVWLTEKVPAEYLTRVTY